MKRKILELYILPGILIILLLLPHILYFNNHYVDFEPLYVEAASEIAANGVNANLSEYFSKVGNPVFTSLILSVSYTLLWESPVISRLTIFFISLVFSLFFYYYLRKKEGVYISFVTALLVIVNPLFIVYSQYVDSDITFMAFSSTALLLLLFSSSLKENIVSSIFLGISLATKYVTLVILPVAIILSFVKSGILNQFSKTRLLSLIRFNIWYFVLPILISIPVILISFHFQKTILSPSLQTIHTFDVSLFIPRFLAYLLWLGLFIGPSCVVIIYDLWRKIGKLKLLTLLTTLGVLTYIISLSYPISSLHTLDNYFGEMNLSWVESYVPSPYLSWALFLVLIVAELFIADLTLEAINQKDGKIINIFFWILVPILLMSLTRVANRYLLVLLIPSSLYTAYTMIKMCSEHKKYFPLMVLILHTLVFITIGFYSNYYLQQRMLTD